jgi:hypothetical protein
MSEQQYTIEKKLAEVVRELDFRREVYPFRVKMKVMRQEEADRRIAILAAIAKDYDEAIAKDYDEVLNATESDGNDEDNRTA